MFDRVASAAVETALGTAGFLALSGALLAPLEVLRPLHGRRRSMSANTLDVALLLSGAFGLNVLRPVFDALTGKLQAMPLASLANRQPLPMLVCEVFLLAELLGYGLHRLMHRVPLLWRIHSVHHGGPPLNWLAAWRQHPLDVLLQALVTALPGMALGCPLSQFVGLVVVRRVWTSVIHSDLGFDLDWLAGVIATPAFHHRHHSPRSGDHGTNFAGTLPILDRVFGTLRQEPGVPSDG